MSCCFSIKCWQVCTLQQCKLHGSTTLQTLIWVPSTDNKSNKNSVNNSEASRSCASTGQHESSRPPEAGNPSPLSKPLGAAQEAAPRPAAPRPVAPRPTAPRPAVAPHRMTTPHPLAPESRGRPARDNADEARPFVGGGTRDVVDWDEKSTPNPVGIAPPSSTLSVLSVCSSPTLHGSLEGEMGWGKQFLYSNCGEGSRSRWGVGRRGEGTGSGGKLLFISA
jgi:hypothetical protein